MFFFFFFSQETPLHSCGAHVVKCDFGLRRIHSHLSMALRASGIFSPGKISVEILPALHTRLRNPGLLGFGSSYYASRKRRPAEMAARSGGDFGSRCRSLAFGRLELLECAAAGP